MTRHEPDTSRATSDPLLQRYQEANALDGARPAPGLREAVLAQARQQSASDSTSTPFEAPQTVAANDRTWTLRALGTLAALGLVGLLVVQFDRGTVDEREIAFGAPSPAPSATSAPSRAEIATAPETIEPLPVPREPAAEARTESAQTRPAPAARQQPVPPPAAAPMGAPESPLDRRAIGPDSHIASPEAGARSRAAAPAMSMPAPPAASAEATLPALQAAPESPTLPALLRAAQTGDLASAREAIARGDDPDATDMRGRTALMTAAERGDLALVRLLLDAGADAARADQNGRTAADLARQAGHLALLDLL